MSVTAFPGTPDLLSLHAADPRRYPFLLQSSGNEQGWDILFAFPQHTVSRFLGGADATFFEVLDRSWHEHAAATDDERAAGLPFHGGWFVYLGYELLHELEPTVPQAQGESRFPLAWLTRIPAAVLVDRARRETWLFAEPGYEECLAAMRDDLEHAPAASFLGVGVEALAEEDERIFLDGVARIKDYIRAGDVFQVNLARRWQGRLASSGAAAELYAALRSRNPAPFSGIADFGDRQIVSSSPERLVRVRSGLIETRPIAGTHPRSSSPQEDERLRRALIESAKERAEHIMLIDLERNDLGRICVPGSVEVDELMAVCSYAHVHHIESGVCGRLRAGITPGQALSALFPGGTITGCPKVRTMQIIRELEQSPRLAYTGSMGYLNRDGGMDLNILIRTFMLEGDMLSFKAGAGIVADSDPARELAETRAKAKGLLKTLG
ncbi:MAG: aminodeoxychorismate synthase component I [Pseudomonadota bacterium]|jgi:anthranilate synthase component 1